MKGEVSVVRLHEIAIATFVTLTLAVAAWADPQAQNSDSKHLGVKSCSGDNCHGAVKPAEHSAVMQNEYLIWSQETDKDRVDKHHRAYAVLGDERGIRIARNLGLPDAVTAEICLNCHADNVPETRRGPRFEISDGVGARPVMAPLKNGWASTSPAPAIKRTSTPGSTRPKSRSHALKSACPAILVIRATKVGSSPTVSWAQAIRA